MRRRRASVSAARSAARRSTTSSSPSPPPSENPFPSPPKKNFPDVPPSPNAAGGALGSGLSPAPNTVRRNAMPARSRSSPPYRTRPGDLGLRRTSFTSTPSVVFALVVVLVVDSASLRRSASTRSASSFDRASASRSCRVSSSSSGAMDPAAGAPRRSTGPGASSPAEPPPGPRRKDGLRCGGVAMDGSRVGGAWTGLLGA